MIQVLSEVSFLDFLEEVLVCRCDYADIDRYVLVASNAGEFLLLENPQNLRLGGEAHVTDFVEEKGSLVCLLEFSLMLLDG